MYSVYIIYSSKLDRYYVGHSSDIQTRLIQHNSGLSDFTSKATDWIIKYHQVYNLRSEAQLAERAIKKKKSRRYIEWLINNH